MKEFYDSEFHFSPEENELKRVTNDAPELTDPFYDEYRLSAEPKRVIYDEYRQGSGRLPEDKADKRRAKLKKYLLMQAASALAIVSVVTAAAGADPLGSNSLVGGGSSVTPSPGGSSIVTPVTPAATEDDDVFPTLGNLNPDFAGNYAWGGMGSEEYVFVDSNYLHAGTYYTDGGTPIVTLPGASYDKDTNTLTLNNYHGSVVDVNLMGNGFTIELIGDNSLDIVRAWGAMYGGSVTFSGSGSLTINKSGNSSNGILLNCEYSPSCLMVRKGVKLDVYGENGAMIIGDSTLDKTIYVSKSLTVTGGEITVVGQQAELYNEDGSTYMQTVYACTVLGADGDPATHVTIE